MAQGRIRVVGVIPARGGSKSIPRKNLKEVAGKPLIAHTIIAAMKTKLVSRVIVSTDDEEIARVSRDFGVDVPILRPRELAKDDSPTILSVQHMVRHLEEHGESYDVVVTLQPTSPLRSSEDIDGAIKMLGETKADSVISVTEVKQNPWLMFKVEDGRLKPFFGEEKRIRRQDLPRVYALNGAIYATRRKPLMEGNSLYGSDPRAYIMPEERSIDIDSLLDLKIVDFLIRSWERGVGL